MAIVMVAALGFVLPQRAPTGPVLDNPVQQGLLEADIVSHLLTFNPFVTENFRPLGQKLLIEG